MFLKPKLQEKFSSVKKKPICRHLSLFFLSSLSVLGIFPLVIIFKKKKKFKNRILQEQCNQKSELKYNSVNKKVLNINLLGLKSQLWKLTYFWKSPSISLLTSESDHFSKSLLVVSPCKSCIFMSFAHMSTVGFLTNLYELLICNMGISPFCHIFWECFHPPLFSFLNLNLVFG